MNRVVHVGVLGLGTVGSGVVQILQEHGKKIGLETGSEVKVKTVVVRDLEKERDVSIKGIIVTREAEELLHDADIDIVVEVMGGIQEAKEHIIKALQYKKHVVTANKDLMAVHGAELLQLANENHCELLYEASVAGGIPILRGLADGLASDHIEKMMGILNGTTNYILTKMSQNGWSYEEALQEAKRLGFAESDPTADVDGLDAARKVAILANLGFSMNVSLDEVYVRGIRNIEKEDLEIAEKLGFTMKLIGKAEREGSAIHLSVAPTLLPSKHPLSSVNNEFNAVYVHGQAVGEVMFYGPGAGKLPTGSAVVSDIVAIVKKMNQEVQNQDVCKEMEPYELKQDKDIVSKYFLRIILRDEPGMFHKVTECFENCSVSFEEIIQLPINKEFAEIVIVTHQTSKYQFSQVLQLLEDVASEIKSYYSIEEEKQYV
ncbi:homoserine dehydrogenase [Bacillus cytotoxicus]|uniref:Homoserine dehydrogenase n=1 Tax=Bacillus cytotoxicus TaxID=580165 RepID=A0AAX2CFQ6_9BACI|nr:MULTISPECIES: homoserine dehydrogenase [Bacillus cereus group]QTR77690.1 homoserine dehydrogenase [Bacillus cytotoxicus]QTR82490.1 homoserine dehydrogenase [Bacillus cytotoxicus]QTR86228.1 homoserine dehydrogenase [Bacillus cytotoxicus]SCL90100.1 Homoserine dehydrogenase [Bacillus cytotoxicus]HDR4571554.1 homoserine dehydrogenase [Bacillus cytotoxicus]